MKVLKKILLVLLVLLVLAQVPFVYRRYQIGKVAAKIAETDANRQPAQDPRYNEYKGIIHAHTNLGGHSTGSFDELIAAANANDLDFVLLTEHYSDVFDTAAQTLNGVHGKTLFVGGNEIDTTDGDRFLLIPGGGEAVKARMSGTTAFLDAAHRENKLALVTYPERLKSWDAQFDGIEVFSLHTAAKAMNPLTALGDLIWTYPGYPELMLAQGWTRPDANLAKFDEIAAQRNISLFAGTDAHSNIGFHLFGDDAANKPLGIKLDPYETMFRMARMHVLIEKDKPMDRESLIEAIRAGNFFIGFDAIGDTTGFSFVAVGAGIAHPTHTMGQEIVEPVSALKSPPWQPGLRFVAYKNGAAILDTIVVDEFSFQPQGPGTYRIEVYRNDLGPPLDKMPWIISNPIYLR